MWISWKLGTNPGVYWLRNVRDFYCTWKCWLRDSSSCERDLYLMGDGKRYMHSSVYCYEQWQGSNCNNVWVHVCMCPACVCVCETLRYRRAIDYDASGLKSNISSPSVSAAVAATAAALIRLCSPVSRAGMAEQTDCIKRACVVLSLTLEWGTEQRRTDGKGEEAMARDIKKRKVCKKLDDKGQRCSEDLGTVK